MTKPYVIAISGASGCGKTTTIKSLAAQFNCPYLLFDNFIDKDTYPADMKVWFQQGADVSLIKTPRFTQALNELLSSSLGSDFIFIEEPFGRGRKSLSSLIDKVILLDTPLATCLSRVIKRGQDKQQTEEQLQAYLTKYQDYLFDIYAATSQQVRDNCDLITDEDLPNNNVVLLISQWLIRARSSNTT